MTVDPVTGSDKNISGGNFRESTAIPVTTASGIPPITGKPTNKSRKCFFIIILENQTARNFVDYYLFKKDAR